MSYDKNFLCFYIYFYLYAKNIYCADTKCYYNGTKIKLNDKYIPDNTKPCRRCICSHTGPILCEILTCGKLECSQEIEEEKACCLKEKCIGNSLYNRKK